MATTSCPVCGEPLVPFDDLPEEDRARYEDDPERQHQSIDHRREKHTACPSCGLELHGCGQPYAIPAEATPNQQRG